MIDIIVSSILIFIFCFLLIYSALTWLKNKKLSIQMIQATIDKHIAIDFISEKIDEDMNNEIQAKDDFIKFLSDSRDWSFKYIEDVQKGIDSFIKEVEPEINYFNEFGVVGSAYPHYYSMKKISESYKGLKDLLPEDYGKIE